MLVYQRVDIDWEATMSMYFVEPKDLPELPERGSLYKVS
jgi:hypothetical protein